MVVGRAGQLGHARVRARGRDGSPRLVRKKWDLEAGLESTTQDKQADYNVVELTIRRISKPSDVGGTPVCYCYAR